METLTVEDQAIANIEAMLEGAKARLAQREADGDSRAERTRGMIANTEATLASLKAGK